MKYLSIAFLMIFCSQPGMSAPLIYHKAGPVQCSVPPLNLKKDSVPWDTSPDAISLALKYQKQLFDTTDGKQILQSAKQLSEYYSVTFHVDRYGNMDNGILDSFNRSKTGPRARLESDIDRLVRTKWNKPSPLNQPMKTDRIFRLKITPDGNPHVVSFLR